MRVLPALCLLLASIAAHAETAQQISQTYVAEAAARQTGFMPSAKRGDALFRKRFAKLAEERELALRDSFAQAGVDALELSTDSDLLDALLRFAELRELRSRASSGGGLPGHLEARSRQPAEARR